MYTHNLLNRLEISADSPNSSTKACGTIFYNLFLSVKRDEPYRFSSKNKEHLLTGFDWIQKERIPTREDEEKLFTGFCLLVATLRRSLSYMTNVPNIVHQMRCHLKGIVIPSEVVLEFVEKSHDGMMQEQKAVTPYAFVQLDRPL